ncbi:phosphatidate cytidylyltransferase [Modestobacter sp. VKM Ac-2979]|uniref:phosphatidate cytidylyltransferase n=1 Tax=unclassified Modestobacter TaxID=2643866 RepID=UPI0022ABA923|nr:MULTISPECIES: phosphatidate cytidylyltransferase [unclassified Modestobacter]MCZ2812671.1 phosphatidate cytidylyltransferase [Modestobacter sp. VKM Ac-2979]MCZ2841561.1 phosphatidate cytidylyltransferase [Modestobacter sp. VKM Ac-2980]
MTRDPHRPEPLGSGRQPARSRAGIADGPGGKGEGAAARQDPDTGPLVRIDQPPVPPRPAVAPRGARPGPVAGPETNELRRDDEGADAVPLMPGGPAVEARDREAGHEEAPADAPLTAVPDALGAEVTGEPPQDTPSGAPRAVGRAGRDMAAAVGVGLALGAVVFATLLLWRPSFLAVVTAAVLISVVELSGALEKGGHRPPRTPVLVGAVVMAALAWTRGPSGLVIAFLLTVFAVLLWRLGDGPVGYLRDASAAVFVALYVPLLAGFAVLLLAPDDGAARVLTFIGTVVCSDVGGFAAGVLFGKHPLARTVSPKKSWEGLAGSVAACVLIGTLLITLVFDGPWWGGVLFGVAIAVTATLGDLGESLIKRDLGIKDMGDLLPGHGGLMDRMDSLLPSAAVAWLILSMVAPV